MSETSNNVSNSSAWVYHPVIDLIIGCGAWTAPLLILANPFINSAPQNLAMIFYLLSLFCNYPHYMATIYRAYRNKEDFVKYKFFTLYLTSVLIILGVFAHFSHKILAIIFTVFLTWSPWHYMGQNFGLFMMLNRRTGVEISKIDRSAIYLAFLASYLMLFFGFHTGASLDPYVLSLGIPEVVGKSAKVTCLAMFLLTGSYGLISLISKLGLRAMLAPLVLFSTEFLWFVLPTTLQMANLLDYVPQARYSTGVLAIMHSVQYLWITSYYRKRELSASTNDSSWRLLPYLATLIVGGIALFIPGPWLISYVFSYDFGTSFLVFTALINIHHFLLDGAIWKLRDNRIADLLISSKEKLSESKVTEAFTGLTSWIISSKTPARTLRVVLAIILLIFASIDQTRFFLLLNDTNLSYLTYAEKLNPNDSIVKSRLALIKANANNLEETISILKSALALNPYDLENQNRLAQILVENQRFGEAYDHYQKMLGYIKLDANSWLNFGILATQLNKNDEAISYWEKSIELDSKEITTVIYLADSYFRKSEYAKAITYYESFLTLTLEQTIEQRPTPKELISVALKLSECYVQTNFPEQALKYSEQALKIAESSKDRVLHSFALVKLAELMATLEDFDKAILTYQKALKLDEEIKDNKISSIDWFNYGKILVKANASETMILSCFLKAESLIKNTPGEELTEISRAINDLEKMTGVEKAKIVEDLDNYANKALNLKP
ncbi:MAG: tetratricopeptide repeat protein [Acidobacteria bacterium]|nr:tetratricopeptide repeat protein [Acidobacteriota bacterium]